MYSRDQSAAKIQLREDIVDVLLKYQADEGYKWASDLLRYFENGHVKLCDLTQADADEIIEWTFAPWGRREEKYIILRFGKRGKLKVAVDV